MRILVALIFMLTLNMLMYGTQLAVNDIATATGTTGPTIITVEGTPLDTISGGQRVTPSNPSELVPEGGSTGVSISMLLLWPFQVFLGWLNTAGAFMWSIATAVPTFLTALHVPAEYVWMLGSIWYITIVTLIILVALGHY